MPGQILIADAVIVIAGIIFVPIIMVRLLLVAVVGEAQDKLLVNIALTILPLVKVFVLKVLLFVPAFIPFTFH